MAIRGDNEGFASTPLEEKGAHHEDSYFPLSDENASEFKDTDAEFNLFVTSPGDLRDLGRLFRYEPRRSPGLIA